ncbi:hypothetical protein [Samia ricini nucleopolyhedrovirus]|nr:hypothetical protein [Philosamia cynthia ricini nucleopolyhedrovirus virus]BBD51209.1 hypothetical protein [Samia ricini nucleopolyhedrovirus]BBD51361.1 hypothetical protein [Samia ricini nucleopolyhedrovirus]BBD51513.1 hypothetical protein [Samia ricini nucleopolyhedrovirus]
MPATPPPLRDLLLWQIKRSGADYSCLPTLLQKVVAVAQNPHPGLHIWKNMPTFRITFAKPAVSNAAQPSESFYDNLCIYHRTQYNKWLFMRFREFAETAVSNAAQELKRIHALEAQNCMQKHYDKPSGQKRWFKKQF